MKVAIYLLILKFKFGNFGIVNDEWDTKKVIGALFWKTGQTGILKFLLNFPSTITTLIWNFQVTNKV